MSKPHREAGTAFIQTQQLHHMCCLGIHTPPITKLKEMIKSGMKVACLNFSHGTREYHVETIKNVHTATEIFASDPILYRPVALALDTKGPEIRTGLIKGSSTAEVGLKMGATLRIMLDNAYMKKCDENILWLDYKNICKVTEVDDGLISLQVKQKGADFLVTEVENGGSLGSKKGVNLPGVAVDLPAVSEKDIQDPKFGVEQDVDMVFASFIRKASDVHEVREKVFLAQKMMIGWCSRAGKSVINSDVANAADCIMLSGETAKGDYLEAGRKQHLIALEAEAAIYHFDPTKATTVGANETSFKCCSGAIIILTKSGRSAHQVARYHPRAPIIAVTQNPQTAGQAHLYRGIFPVLCQDPVQEARAEDVDLWVNLAMNVGKAGGFFKKGDVDVAIALIGWRPGSGFTNTMRVVPVW
uniref:Pyruvate kinase n=1 Tax=Rhinopithecus roxellana TaxID=61622 RepID=A0A2K6QFF3_RHIRO